MKRKLTIGVLILAGVLAISTGIGIAMARSADANSNLQAGFYAPGDGGAFAGETVGQWYCGGRGLMGGYLTPQVAALLKLTPEQIQTQLDTGKTLAEIATAQGVTPDQLLQTMMGSYGDHLALMVKDGYLTQAQADTMSQQAKTRLQNVITSKLDFSNGPRSGIGGMMRGWFNGAPQSGTGPTPGYGCGGTGASSNQTSESSAGSTPTYGRGMMGRW
jgi:hypothetical protein